MPESIGPLLLLMCLLQLKHMIADFFLQTSVMLRGRGVYLHAGRLLHVLFHGALTAVALLAVATPISFVATVVVVEMVVHFHIDFVKSRVTLSRNLNPAQAAYWQALGVDQALHQLTYVAILAVWLWSTSGI